MCVPLTLGRRGRVPHRNSGSASSPWGNAQTGHSRDCAADCHSTGILEDALGAELGQKLPLGLSQLRQRPLKETSVSQPQEPGNVTLFGKQIFADTTHLRISRQDHPGLGCVQASQVVQW